MDINFYCSPSRTNKKGLADIVITVGIKGYKRITVALPMKYEPSLFKKEIASSKGGMSKTYCEKVRNKINAFITELIDKDKPIVPEEIKAYIERGCADKTYTLNNLFSDFLAIQYKRIGSEINQEMYDRYIKAKDTFFTDLDYTGEEAADVVTYDTIAGYKATLLKKLKTSTVSTRLNRIKAVFKYGFNSGKLKVFPFQNIKINKGVTDDIKYLTPEELNKIKDKVFTLDRLNKVKDLFLFQCYSGLSYIDMKNLGKDDIHFHDGTKLYYIKKKRQKTGVEFFTILIGDALEIITKYDFKLPVISNQKMNAYLKEIGDLAGIEKEITTHTGRHSFAVLLLNNGFSKELTAKCLGHTDVRMTERYAKVLDTTLLEHAGKIQQKLMREELNKMMKELN